MMQAPPREKNGRSPAAQFSLRQVSPEIRPLKAQVNMPHPRDRRAREWNPIDIPMRFQN